MFNPVLFELGGVLLAGGYLLGQHRWSVLVTITSARLVCRPPDAGTLTLALEVGGVLTGDEFTVTAGDGAEVRETLTLSQPVPANALVRWRISAFTGADEESATAAAITMILV